MDSAETTGKQSRSATPIVKPVMVRIYHTKLRRDPLREILGQMRDRYTRNASATNWDTKETSPDLQVGLLKFPSWCALTQSAADPPDRHTRNASGKVCRLYFVRCIRRATAALAKRRAA